MRLPAIVLLSIVLGGAFGEATASGRDLGGTMEVDIAVEAPAGGVVVAHLVVPGGPERTVALRERSPGVYGAIVEVAPVDLVVVFEAVSPSPATSSPVTLTELGLAPSAFGVGTPGEASPDTGRRRWLALGLTAGLLAAALAFAGRRQR